jgi:uncharacterized membrane protein YdjX (TVP38/TMEM64 family)
MKQPPYRTLLLVLAVFALIIAPFCLFGASVDAWTGRLLQQASEHPWAAGALLAALLATDIVLPVPSSLASTACGLALGFAGGACASFLGMGVSALAGYALGRCAAPSARRLIGEREAVLLDAFLRRHGVWMLLALRPVPVLAEASVLFSGVVRLPFGRVLAAAAAGNAGVSLVYAAIGAWGRVADSFLPAFAASMALSGLALAVIRLRRTAAPPSRLG